MSVYTPLSLAQVQQFAHLYDLDICEIQPIQGGMENTNYFLHARNQQQYVLTLFEAMDSTAAAKLTPVLQHLAQHGIPVAVPLLQQNQAIHTLAEKPAQIAPRLQGEHPTKPNLAQVKSMATYLAKLHLALAELPSNLNLTTAQFELHDLWLEMKPHLSQADAVLLDYIQQQFEDMRQQYPNRPQGWIHADLFRDNSLFINDEISAILDFSELHINDLLIDIAICINDFCTNLPDAALDLEKAHAFLTAYAALRPLTEDERACLNIYLCFTASRFWLGRLKTNLHNQKTGQTGPAVLYKDPEEMRLIAIDRMTQEYCY